MEIERNHKIAVCITEPLRGNPAHDKVFGDYHNFLVNHGFAQYLGEQQYVRHALTKNETKRIYHILKKNMPRELSINLFEVSASTTSACRVLFTLLCEKFIEGKPVKINDGQEMAFMIEELTFQLSSKEDVA